MIKIINSWKWITNFNPWTFKTTKSSIQIEWFYSINLSKIVYNVILLLKIRFFTVHLCSYLPLPQEAHALLQLSYMLVLVHLFHDYFFYAPGNKVSSLTAFWKTTLFSANKNLETANVRDWFEIWYHKLYHICLMHISLLFKGQVLYIIFHQKNFATNQIRWATDYFHVEPDLVHCLPFQVCLLSSYSYITKKERH